MKDHEQQEPQGAYEVTKTTSKSMKKFWLFFCGQFASLLGSRLSSFGLSIWIYLETQSALFFSLAFFVTIVPEILLSPIAGSLADRKDRKVILILCDSLDAVLKLCVLILFASGVFQVWMVLVFNFLSSSLSAVQGPAYIASIPVIVPKDQLGKANSMLMFSRSVRMLIAPVIAGLLHPIIGLTGLFAIDFVTYFFAIITMLPQNLEYERKEDTGLSFFGTVRADVVETIRFLKGLGSFIAILYSVMAVNFVASLVGPLLGPLVLSIYDSQIYGVVESAFGGAMIVGALISGFMKSKDKMKSIYIAICLQGLALALFGVRPEWVVITAGVIAFGLVSPRTNTLFSVLIQSKVPSNMMGKVSAAIGAMSYMGVAVASLLAGGLADFVFNPLLVEGGVLSQTIVGELIGVGPTRGIGFMFICAGLIIALIALYCLSKRNIMNFDRDCPDAIEA